jgi:ATP synthase protein I
MPIRQVVENRPNNPDDLKRRLEALDGRIDHARKGHEKEKYRPGSRSDDGALGLALQLSATFISSVAAGGLLGWGMDWLIGSSPWGLIICLLLGFGAGMQSLLRAAVRTQ